MAAKFSQHVALTEPLARYVADQVAKGEYATASEVIRAGLRMMIEREEDRARTRADHRQQTSDAAMSLRRNA